MSSYRDLLKDTKPRFESPAKVFAKLKSKVQREGICAMERTFTEKDPLGTLREKHGADFQSPKKRAERTWTPSELCGSNRIEAQALTLSPISSPQKTSRYSVMSSKLDEEMPYLTEAGHGCSPRKRTFLESTAVSHPFSVVSRQRIHTEPLQIRDSGGFRLTSRTPVKTQPVENDQESCVFEEECASHVFSPMRKRLRTTKWEFNKVSSSTKEVSKESISQPQERKPSGAFSEDNTCMEDLGNVRGFPADPSEMTHFTRGVSTAMKRCSVDVEKVPLMSPAKMFSYMKQRGSKTKQQEVHVVSSSTGDHLLDAGNFHQSRDMPPPSSAHNMSEQEDISQSDTDPSEDVLKPAVSPQHVLLEDALVLNTPRISIPKKQEAVFKQKKWPQSSKFPSESVIHLEKWFLRRNSRGLFVDGIHQADNIPWNSNIIVERVSNSVVKTVSGRVYVLVGKMKMTDSGLPKWLLKKFANGFPPDWEALYERFMLESRDDPSREAESKRERRSVMSKTKSEAPSSVRSVKRNRQKSLKTPDSCPPAFMSHAKVSRSGRVIKPPLEYWKGGRVILDAHMNVTIHECYDTSICIPEVTTTVSRRASQKPARVFLPCSEGHKKCESASDEKAPVPLRRVKAPLGKRNCVNFKPEEKPSYSPELSVETLRSPEKWPVRSTRSNARQRATERALYVSQKQSKPENTAKRQTRNNTRPMRVLDSKRATPAPPKPVHDQTSASSDDGVIGRKKPGKEAHRKRSRSRPSYVFPSSESSNESSDDIERELRKRTTETQTKHQSRCTKSSSPTNPLPKLTKSNKRKTKANRGNTPILQERDVDEWTEDELMKLQEAVSCYPNHMVGYWAKVARMVGTRSAEECHYQHTSKGASKTPAKRAKKPKKPQKERVEVPKNKDHPDVIISARAGTLKRKQQERQFLETMPRENVEDVFSSAYMQSKRFEMPSMCPSDHDFTTSEMVPLTPTSTAFPGVKTPQCLHITPGMMGSPNRNSDDKYVYQLQKRMKKNQFNVCKQAPSSKTFTPTPSVKRTMRRCGNTENDTFVVWEMFPGNDALSESGEEEDFYFSDNY